MAQVQSFYDVLLAGMKQGGTTKARYDRLAPVIEKTFDLPGMTATAIGLAWPSLSAADQKALIEAFTRMTVANYAKNFDSYSGEKFVVDPMAIARGSEKFVKSSLKPASGEAVAFNYRMHEVDGAWKISDIYLAGNISQMAQRRSDFAGTFAASGPQGLVKRMNALSDQLLAP